MASVRSRREGMWQQQRKKVIHHEISLDTIGTQSVVKALVRSLGKQPPRDVQSQHDIAMNRIGPLVHQDVRGYTKHSGHIAPRMEIAPGAIPFIQIDRFDPVSGRRVFYQCNGQCPSNALDTGLQIVTTCSGKVQIKNFDQTFAWRCDTQLLFNPWYCCSRPAPCRLAKLSSAKPHPLQAWSKTDRDSLLVPSRLDDAVLTIDGIPRSEVSRPGPRMLPWIH